MPNSLRPRNFECPGHLCVYRDGYLNIVAVRSRESESYI